jgi:hypothetical protein
MSDPVQILPADVHNQALVANVHPAAWQNPEPARALFQPLRPACFFAPVPAEGLKMLASPAKLTGMG